LEVFENTDRVPNIEVRPIATESQVNEMIAALTG
jgi:hypothetical protein